MFKKIIHSILLISFSFWAFHYPAVAQTQEAMMAMVHEDMAQYSIKDRVKILRNERFERMPYLNRSYIRSEINSKKLEEKIEFIQGEQKSLSEIVGRTIQINTAARAAREQLYLQKRRIILAFRDLLPEVTYELQYREGALSSSGFNSRFYKFSFVQPIFRGGILWNTFLQEKVGLEGSKKEYEKIISDLINEVSGAYLEYQRATKVMESQGKAIENLQKFVIISQKKHKEEMISEIEHLNVDSLFSQVGYDYETSKQEWELARLELQKHLKLELDDHITIEQLYDIQELLTQQKASSVASQNQPQAGSLYAEFRQGINIPNLDVLVDLAYQHRPELQAEAAKLQSAILEERIRWGEMMPHVDINLDFGKLGEAFNIDSSNPGGKTEFRLLMDLSWNAAGNRINWAFENDQRAPSVSQFTQAAGTKVVRNTISIGLLDGLDSLVEAKEAHVAKLDQIVELENMEKEVIHDVKNSYYEYQKSLIQVQSTLKRVDYRRRLAELSAHRLGKNEIQVSEYVQADIDVLNEETELHRAIRDYYIAKVELNRALGMRDFLKIEEDDGEQSES